MRRERGEGRRKRTRKAVANQIKEKVHFADHVKEWERVKEGRGMNKGEIYLFAFACPWNISLCGEEFGDE